MNELITFSVNEYKKLFRQTKAKITIVLFALCSIAIGIGSIIIENNTGVKIVAPGRFPVFVLELLIGFVLPVLTIFICSELFAAEFKDSTIKNLFALPVTKSIIYLGKMLAGAAFTGTCLLMLSVSGIAVSAVINGTMAFESIGSILISYLGAFIFLGAVLSIVGFFTLIAGSPSIAIAINLLIWFVSGITGTFITGIRQFMPTSFSGWHQPLISGVNMTMALPPLLYMLAYCIIFAVAGLLIFERKEV
ncbi:MAG: hypothetical protein K0R50_3715 [Eubacterium sp.]|jgi:ABC-type transport system involved in multi-copper enzyme maturation permease subunit|nr:hypothetical protein [Eubacterium sp.]